MLTHPWITGGLRAKRRLDDRMPSSRSGRLQALYLAWPESFVEQLLQGLVPTEHPGVYHLPMVKEHKLGDIIANSVTHGIGAALALAGAVILVVTTVGGTAWQIASCLVFGCTLVLVYVCSTLYHSLVRTRARHVLQIIDHSAICLLIAGTYTPFALVSLRGQLGWLLFAIVWGLAILGNSVQEFRNRTFRRRVGRRVCGNGLAGRVRDASFTARSHGSRHSLDCAGGPALYRRHSLLRFRPPVLLPRVMASLCAGRKHLSLLRRALLCCLAPHLTRKRLQLISKVFQSRGLIG